VSQLGEQETRHSLGETERNRKFFNQESWKLSRDSNQGTSGILI